MAESETRNAPRKEGQEMKVITKAKELAVHTFKLTINTNRYPKKLRHSLVDKHVDKRIREHEAKRMDELSAFMSTVDANWLYTLHTELGFGQKRLRRAWEAMVRNRIAIREFYRDGQGGYEEQRTGKNVEDEATIKALINIGVDIKAWEREEIHLDKETGEVTFGGLTLRAVKYV